MSPTDFNVYNLLPFESKYLLYRLRVLTYGSEHTFKDRCPSCGNINDIDVNLNDITVVEVPDDFSLIFDVPVLPITGTKIKCKLLTEGELKSLRKKADEIKKNTNNEMVDIDILWESRIVSINGKKDLAPIEITQYLDELPDYDSEYLMAYYDKYQGNYGLQTQLHYECDNCKTIVDSEMPSIYTFFRPTITFNNFK